MKKICALCAILFNLGLTHGVRAQVKRIDSLITRYHRSSIYSLVMEHPGFTFGNEIKQEFFKIPVSDKYNDHNLSVRSFYADDDILPEVHINNFLNRHFVSKRIVSKWFDREKDSGFFDMDLVWNRGYYDATEMDYQIASKTIRGNAIIADIGEELIGNTFVVVNDIQYIDKEKRAMKVSFWLDIISSGADIVGGVSSGKTQYISNSLSSLANSGSEVSDLIAGFKVTITSYLYRLVWNEDDAASFFQKYYYDKDNINVEKKVAFERDTNVFKLQYVGKYSVRSAKTVLRGVKSNEEVIRKVCARALDDNIVKLQRKYESFKVKAPIYSVSENYVLSPIGKKEGVTINSRFEVLEQSVDVNGKTHYSRVGIVRPVIGKIWDNRFMAVEEGANGADLNYTEFKRVSGRGFYPGMLIREIR